MARFLRGLFKNEERPATEENGAVSHSIVRATQNTSGYMVFFSFWIGLSAWICQFDLGYSGTVLLMPPFNSAFGYCQMVPDPITGALVEKCQLSATQQSLGGIYLLFLALGALVSGITGSFLGRRGAIQVSCLLTVVGAAGMLGTSGNYVNYLVCHCISGVGLGGLQAVTPIYGVECTPPRTRGMLLGFFYFGSAAGNLTAAAVCLGSSGINNNWAWQTPIICQIPIGVIYGLGILMFPESPRWLMSKGREESARRSFGRFFKKDPYSEEISGQVQEVQNYIDFEKSLSSTTSWTEIFHRSYIRRTFVSALIMVMLAVTGVQFLGPYAAIFFSDVGINDPYLITVIFGACVFVGVFFAPFMIEYAGRRFTMLVGMGSMALCMLIFSTVSSGLGSKSRAAQDVVIAFSCMWAFVFGATIGSTVWLASAEIHSVRLRTYGQSFTQTIYQIVAFASNFWTPYMLNKNYGNMGANVGYFYCGVTVVMFILFFLFVPETARLSLEQIDDYFASGRRAWKTSISRNKKIAKGELYDVSPEAHEAAILTHAEK